MESLRWGGTRMIVIGTLGSQITCEKACTKTIDDAERYFSRSYRASCSSFDLARKGL